MARRRENLPLKIVVIRHRKEKLSKCSLSHLEDFEGIDFITGDPGNPFDATGYTLVSMEGEIVTREDSKRPLLLLDSTWKLLPRLEKCIEGNPAKRTLPRSLKTAYPRKSKLHQDPEHGLASVEALYAALFLMGFDVKEILEGYRWARDFLRINKRFFSPGPGIDINPLSR